MNMTAAFLRPRSQGIAGDLGENLKRVFTFTFVTGEKGDFLLKNIGETGTSR